MGIIGLIVIGIYVYLGDKANYYLKYHLLNVRAELYGDTFNYLLKRAVAGAFLGWATIPVAIIHYLLTSKASSSRNTDMDAPEEIDNNMNSAPRNSDANKSSFNSGKMYESRTFMKDLKREATQLALIARDGDGYIQSLIQVIDYVDMSVPEATRGELTSGIWGNTNRTKDLEKAHWEHINPDFTYWLEKAKGLGVKVEDNKIIEIGMIGFTVMVQYRHLKNMIESSTYLKRVDDLGLEIGFYLGNVLIECMDVKPYEYMEKFNKSGWTVEIVPSQFMRVRRDDETSDRWVMKGWE